MSVSDVKLRRAGELEQIGRYNHTSTSDLSSFYLVAKVFNSGPKESAVGHIMYSQSAAVTNMKPIVVQQRIVTTIEQLLIVEEQWIETRCVM